jgi:hypothetical protein
MFLYSSLYVLSVITWHTTVIVGYHNEYCSLSLLLNSSET